MIRRFGLPARFLVWINLLVVMAIPGIWLLPMFRNSLLLVFGSEISVLGGVVDLFGYDLFLALVILVFAMVFPALKALLLILIWLTRWSPGARTLRVAKQLSRYAMADVFLVAVTVIVLKGAAVGSLELMYGFYVFAFYVIHSLVFTHATEHFAEAGR